LQAQRRCPIPGLSMGRDGTCERQDGVLIRVCRARSRPGMAPCRSSA
jgi:hypothetical protein